MESLKKNVQNDLTSIKVISYLYHSASPSLSLSSWNAKSSAYLTRGGDRGGLGKESEMINGHGKVKDRKSVTTGNGYYGKLWDKVRERRIK